MKDTFASGLNPYSVHGTTEFDGGRVKYRRVFGVEASAFGFRVLGFRGLGFRGFGVQGLGALDPTPSTLNPVSIFSYVSVIGSPDT